MDPGLVGAAVRELAKLVGGGLAKKVLGPSPVAGSGLADEPLKLGPAIGPGRHTERLTERDLERLVRVLLLRVVDAEPRLRALEDGEAVQATLIGTLRAFGELDARAVQEASLDPEKLAEKLRERAPSSDLSPDGQALYESMLIVCATQVIDHFSKAPTFVARTLTEQSAVLGELAGDDNAFRTRYLAYVEPVLDEQQLFGLRLRPDMQTYKLSTAYVSLSMEWVDRAERPISRRPNRDASRAAKAVDRLGPEEILSEHEQLIIDGPAGSGKTTLLKRIALHAIRREFPETLRAWNGLVPFLLRVRQFAEAEFPQPEQFLVSIAPALQGEKPHRWVTNLLLAGKAVLLVDGVDEIPLQRRAALIEWIIGLARAYPRVRMVVTSRPGAVEEQRGRLQSAGFSGARVEPMSQSQVSQFVLLWHKAYAQNVGSSAAITDRGSALISAIDSRRDLARMATSPLLCAMLCALNLNSNSYLPRERTRLYRDAMEMLLERRDREQQIASSVALDSQYLEPILARLAFWMLSNGRRNISDDQAVAQIQGLMHRIHHSSKSSRPLTADDVLDHLVARSGLLQRSSDATIEFRHPSFQDYLAAAEVFRQDQVEHLVRQAHDPLYHDVVIMAVAQTQSDPKRQTDLLLALTGRAGREPLHSRALWLLAAAAIADAGFVDPGIANKIAIATKNLLPPQDFEQAYEIAEAGEFAIDLLNEVVDNSKLTLSEAAAAVRAACLVDAPESLPLLRKLVVYAPDTPLVQSDLLLGWRSAMDRSMYERDVLRSVSFTQASFHAGQPSDLEIFRHLRAIRILSIGEWCTTEDIEEIRDLEQLEELRVSNSRVDALTFLRKWPSLRALDVSRCPVDDVGPVALAGELMSLSLTGSPVQNISALGRLAKLQSCFLAQTGVSSLRALAGVGALRELDVSNTAVTSLEPLSENPALNQLALARSHVLSLGPLASVRHLETVDMSQTGISSVEPLAGLRALHTLDARMSEVSDLGPLAHCPELEVLDLSSTLVTSLRPLTDLSGLVRLDISSTRVPNLAPLGGAPMLREINICGTDIRDLWPLAMAPKLKRVCLDSRQRNLAGADALRSRSGVELIGISQW